MSGPVVIGIDPDSKATAWAAVSGSSVLAVGVLKTKAASTAELLRQTVVGIEDLIEKHQPELAVVEGQHYHYGGKAPPKDIIKLAQIAGGIAGQLVAFGTTKVAIPTPDDWKGQTPKPINQSRTYAHFGILSALASGYAYPTGCKILARVQGAGSLNRSDWKHVGDALGLARYGADKLL